MRVRIGGREDSRVVSEVLLVCAVLVLFAGIALPTIGALEHTAERPSAALGTAYDADDATLTVTHINGESFDGEAVYFVGADGVALGTWGESRVEVGDHVTVDAPADGGVRVVWRGPDGRTHLLAVWTPRS